jgi:hypothetical protein
MWLPESPRFLVVKGDLSPRQAALLDELGVRPGQATQAQVDIAQSTEVRPTIAAAATMLIALMLLVLVAPRMVGRRRRTVAPRAAGGAARSLFMQVAAKCMAGIFGAEHATAL